MKIYNYDQITGEYIGTSEALKSPLDDMFLIPAHATTEVPPALEENKAVVFKGGTWTIKPDYRGKIYYNTATQARYEISDIGIEPDPTWTDKTPLPNSVWAGTDWEIDLSLWLDHMVRPQRDAKLSACDYIMMPDFPMEPAKKSEWESYRQVLRDLPGKLTKVTEPVPWPATPDK